MALINTIREKSGVAVGLVAVGMLLFIVGGDLVGGKNRLFNRNDQVVGEVAGQKVELADYNNALEQAKQAFIAQQQRQPDEQALGYLRDQAWNQTIYRLAFQPEWEKLGLTVSDDELVDMVQGDNINSGIKQAFTDQKTGQFDKARLIEYLKNLDKLPPENQAAWHNFEANLPAERLANKYNALLKNSVYVTTAEAKRYDTSQGTKATVKYLFVPYASISDSAVKVTDAQLQAYLDKNQSKYKVEDGRSVEYITIPVVPSKEDSASVKTSIAELATQFASAPVDSLFVMQNSEQPYNKAFRSPADLPEQLRKQLPLAQGKVYGPYAENGTYSLYKVTGVSTGKQAAARASHILIKPEGTTPEAKAAAKAKAQDILNKIKAGADFAALARQFGTDGTKEQGGDLGWFGQGRMVPEFEKAIFGATAPGLLPNVVETSFGYHVIKITAAPTKQTYQVAEVKKSITPSDATREAAYAKAQQLKGEATDLESFRKLVTKDKTLVKQEAKNLDRSARTVNNLQNARELVRWAFGFNQNGAETKVGDISEVYEMGDQYVIAALTDERAKGTATVTNLKPELSALVRNEEKAKQIMAKLPKAGTLEEMASKYGPTAQVGTAADVVMGQGNLTNVGFEPLAVGKAFALKPGQKSAPIQGEQGVLVVEPVSVTPPATPNTNLKAVQQQLAQQRAQQQDGKIYEAIKAHANVKDSRTKFF
ncbi:SurA N-terminal domain-containing protein [Hymenobacter sp. BT770]|uniref:peptidylprolyl isomerase n=1 Tax=Hymenobacter sp. BT770 TaxID=2886942 RepID=UPI001D12D79A|nr:peptidylprolyl isomerase [Hymenobacter sp. BT770]MCC3153421.1 SurA N-terminal domain-containing protein [Hymenobacter sp. BT770]MDO3415497.1 SurA N-terminal domain-containing protein [Hymenobacter sp. BT770]